MTEDKTILARIAELKRRLEQIRAAWISPAQKQWAQDDAWAEINELEDVLDIIAQEESNMAEPNVIAFDVPNEQHVNEVAERLCTVLDMKILDERITDNVALAAIAETLAIQLGMIDEDKRAAALSYVTERAWSAANAVFVKRESPRPDSDNVTPLPPRED